MKYYIDPQTFEVKEIEIREIGMYYCPYIPLSMVGPSEEVFAVRRKEKEMCIPNIPLEEEEKTFYAETELAYLLSEDVMKEIYKEEMFQQLEKDIQEEESLVVISQFVREMCDYYKIAQTDYVMWQHYYNYLKEELVKSKAQTQLNEEMKQYSEAWKAPVPPEVESKAQAKLNEEMKKHIEETRLEEDTPPAIKFIGDEMALWNAIEKHK